jgi:hypothetical protein
VLVLGHGEETQSLGHKERLRYCQANRSQPRKGDAGDLEFEDPDSVEKEGCFSSIASDLTGVSREFKKKGAWGELVVRTYLCPIAL